MNSLLAFIIVIGVLVFFHELGHFLVAKLCGVGVDTFSLGFGPKILRKKGRETEYCISAIPLGGYVKMVGEEKGTTLPPEDISRSFSHKKLYQKSLIVAAGPFFNFFLAILIFYIIYQFSGVYLLKPVVGDVTKGSPAYQAGIQKGDRVHKIDGKRITSWGDLAGIISSSDGEALDILIQRDGRVTAVTLRPELKEAETIFKETRKRYMIGIAASGETFHRKVNPIEAVGLSCRKNWEIVKLTVISVAKMIDGTVSTKHLGGPIMIAQMAGEQAEAGVINLAFFIALLSINLGIINLFPVPVLDGGHLLFFSIEAVTGREVSDTVREKANQFGIAVLVLLMIFVFYNDIARLVNG